MAGLGEDERLVWVAMITSADTRAGLGDLPFGPAYRRGELPAPSVIRPGQLATIEADHAERLDRIARGDGRGRGLAGAGLALD